jgi:hypothetical protein
MEDVLDIYAKPPDDRHPVVCVDERPCQLHDNVIAPLPTQQGSVKKEDYEYVRNGTCCAFIAVEPLHGERTITIREHRTKEDYALFMNHVAHQYPNAEKIIIVQDNLNTHKAGSFYETFPAEEARRLAERFEFHYTPKKASWLNMAEIEISVLSKRCFDRRIGSMIDMQMEVAAFERLRNMEHAKITWRFTTEHARVKMEKHYTKIRKQAN